MKQRQWLVLAAALAIFAAGGALLLSDHVSAEERQIPIYSVDQSGQKVAISFDAAWGNEHTKPIMDILDAHQAKATFFLVKFWAEKYPDDVKAIKERGFEIGSHSATHPDMTGLSAEQIKAELADTSAAIEKAADVTPKLFRPPFGAYNNTVIETCRESGYHVIQWSVDSLDWKDISAEEITRRILSKAEAGSIILCHNNAEQVENYLPTVLEGLKEKNLQVVSVGELIYWDDYQVDGAGKQSSESQKEKAKE